MKVNGIEFEDATPEEIAGILKAMQKTDSEKKKEVQDSVNRQLIHELDRQSRNKQVVLEQKKTFVPKAKKYKHKSKKDWKALFEQCRQKINNGSSICKAMSEVIGYSTTEYKKQLERYMRKQDKIENKGKTTKGLPDKRVIRMRWITKKAGFLVNQYKYSWEKARTMASQEYSAKFLNKKYKVDMEMPKILDKPEMNKILFDILKNVYDNNGRFIRAQDAYNIGIESKSAWEDLIYSIMRNMNDIKDYLGKNKGLKLVSIDNELILVVS